MDLDPVPADDPRRLAVRSWLAERGPEGPSARDLAEAGYVAPHWPAPWGLGADPDHQVVIDEELVAAGVERPDNPIALGWAGPTILAGGTPDQHQRWLPGILDGSEEWCQLFSEPEAGSDLASLRTRAERDGDDYVVNGQKIWSTWADRSDWGILLARTDPDAPPHRGISYFVVDMRAPGIEVRPIIEMTGGNHFNETFLTDVRVPVDQRIGPENGGWRLAKVTLGNERVSLSSGGVLWGMGPTSPEAMAEVARLGVSDPTARQVVGQVRTEALVIDLLGRRIMAEMQRGGEPGAFASVRKTLADEHGQHLMGLVHDLAGADGMIGVQDAHAEEVDPWHWGYLFARALTIGGGTSEVQRDIIAEQLLGLPQGAPTMSDHDLAEFTYLQFDRDGDVLRVTIDRPDDPLNAVDGTMHHELTRLFAALKGERTARAVLLTGAGRAFSAGGDFGWFPELQQPGALEALRVDARQMIWDLLDVPLPIVAALNGPAVGLGASIALLCDLVVMAESATIADPHVRVGLVAGDGGTIAWPLAVGPTRAKQYLLTGDPVPAVEAERIGLVNVVVPDAELDEVALGWARKLARGAPLAVQHTKAAINNWVKQTAMASFDLAAASEMATFRSTDHAEALEAIRDKRPPTFTGR